MRVGIMQPYFFPYLGHFSLIAHTDQWVVFDITQYTPKAWMNRNRILHPHVGTNWISIPLEHSSIAIKTKEACVADMRQSVQTVLGKLSHYRHKAPYFKQVEDIVRQAFNISGNSLVQLNAHALEIICQYLGLPFRYQICSEMDISLPEDLGPGQWALEIATLMSATAYLNPASGQALFDSTQFDDRGIRLEFLNPMGFEYDTHPYTFIPHLSILDVLMWNDAETTVHAIRSNVEIFPAQCLAA